MRKIALIWFFLIAVNQFLSAQTNPDDYWLDNGFTSGQTVNTNSGFFYDDGGYDVYHENQDWNVTFCSENGEPITIDFKGFRTHFGGGSYTQYDFINIDYPGASYVAYDNDTPEFGFTSQNGCIDIGFHSDGDGMIDSGWVAEIYAVPPPFNNDPTGAEDLIVGNVCSPSFYTNKGAYNTTGLGSPPCKEYFGGDVWFRVVVPPSGVVKIETFAGTLEYAILDIFRSANSTILSSERITCVDDGGAMPSVTLTSPIVSPGNILYIRLFGEQAKSGLFGICASDPSTPVTGFTGPGGVGDSISLDFWYRPDFGLLNASDLDVADNEQVKTWKDQSGNTNDLVQATGNLQPVYNENAINGFGSLQFDGTDDLFALESGSGDAPLHWFAAGSFSGSTRQTMVSIGDGLAGKTASLSRHTDGRYFSFTNSDLYGPLLTDGQYYIFHASHEAVTSYHFLELDGLSQTVDAEAFPLESDGSLQLGASWDNSDPFSGQISELIQYRKILNSAQEIIVNNYLSAKYNIDLDANNLYAYKNSFHFDVAGIGRVDANNTHTKAESAGILAISGADDLNNNEFLLFGHDNGDFSTWNSGDVPLSDTNIVRLDRIWRVTLVGSPGDVTLSLSKTALPPLPAGFVAYNIMLDSDGNFSSGAQTFGPFVISDELVINNVPVSDGDYLCIAAVRPFISFSSANSSSMESISNPTIQVELNYAVSSVVDIDYAVVGSTAIQGIDFSLVNGSVSITPGNKTVNIVPLVIDDSEPEIPDEYFDIEISTASTGVTADLITVARHTIVNDDLELAISASKTITGECTGSFSEIVVTPLGTGPFTYSWTPSAGLDNTTNDTVIANPATTTTYTVEVTDTYGLKVNDNIQIQVIPAPAMPTITVNGSTSVCEGDSVNLSAPAGFPTYIWSDGQSADNIWVTNSGNYNLTVADTFACFSQVSADVIISVNPLPAAPGISAGGPLAFCEGDSVELIAETGYASYNWSDLSSGNTLEAKLPGDYYVSGTDLNGCSSLNSDTLSVIVFSNPLQPLVTPGGPADFCEGDSLKLTAPAAYSSYTWNSGETSREIYVTSAGDYNVVVSDANGCKSIPSSDAVISVNLLPSAPVIIPSGPLSFCEGGSVDLNANPGFGSYFWSDGGTGQFRTIIISGSLSVIGEDSNGCRSPESASIDVIVNPVPEQPLITPGGTVYVITGDSIELTAPASDSYLWSPGGESTQSVMIKTSGTYSLIVGNTFGCQSISSEPVNVIVSDFLPPPEVTIDGVLSFCLGGSVNLIGPVGFSTYTWSNGSSGQNIFVSESGTITLIVTDGDGHESIPSDPLTVTVFDLPGITVSDIREPNCKGGSDGSISLTASGGLAPYDYSWTGFDETSSTLGGIGAGSYTAILTDKNECSVSEIVQLEEPDALEVEIVISDAFCPDFSDGRLELSISGGTEPYSLSWDGGETGEILNDLPPGDYPFSVSDANNCFIESGASVSYVNDFCFTVPEIITPNTDGWNDTWKIEGLEVYPDVTLEVFDRWGKRVFYSEGHDVYFNGTYNGKELPMESYHYVIDLHNGSERIIGNLTIIR